MRIELRGQGGYLNPKFIWHEQTTTTPPPGISIPLQVLETHHDAGHTLVTLARPAGVVPDALSFVTQTTSFERSVRVRDARVDTMLGELGSGQIARGAGLLDDALTLAIARATGTRLQIDISDGDSGALQDLRVAASVERPTLIFDAPAGSTDAPVLMLRYGGARTRAPDYDVAALAAAASNSTAPAKLGKLELARLGTATRNPSFEPARPLAEIFPAGATLDTRPYAFRRRFSVHSGHADLARIELERADLATMRSDFADLRVVDANGLQRPFLFSGADTRKEIYAEIAEPVREGENSVYTITPPMAPITVESLTLDTSAAQFERSYELLAVDPQSRATQLTSGRISRKLGAPSEPLRFDLGPTLLSRLELHVVDADDAALRFEHAKLVTRLPTLYVIAPPGEYALMFGRPDATPARYAHRGAYAHRRRPDDCARQSAHASGTARLRSGFGRGPCNARSRRADRSPAARAGARGRRTCGGGASEVRSSHEATMEPSESPVAVAAAGHSAARSQARDRFV